MSEEQANNVDLSTLKPTIINSIDDDEITESKECTLVYSIDIHVQIVAKLTLTMYKRVL